MENIKGGMEGLEKFTQSTSGLDFDLERLLISVLRTLKKKGVLTEDEIMDALWDAKDPNWPWTKKEMKEIVKL